MRRLGTLLMVLLAAALTTWWLSADIPTNTPSLDGISLGMPRAEVEARLGAPRARVVPVEDGNFTAFVILHEDADGRSATLKAWGNHPPDQGEVELVLQSAGKQGFVYGADDGMPYLGYDGSGRVAWVWGRSLRVGFRTFGLADVASAKGVSPLGSATERPDYCMAGPCAFEYRGGTIGVAFGGEESPSDGAVAIRLGR